MVVVRSHGRRLAPPLALLALAGACTTAQHGGVGEIVQAPASSERGTPEGVLQLVAVQPEPGSLLRTHAILTFVFDRPLDPAMFASRIVAVEYVNPGVVLLDDPFRHVDARLAPDGRSLVVRPPELLAGRTIRVFLTAAIRGVDGRALAPADGASALPPGMVRAFTYAVHELPP